MCFGLRKANGQQTANQGRRDTIYGSCSFERQAFISDDRFVKKNHMSDNKVQETSSKLQAIMSQAVFYWTQSLSFLKFCPFFCLHSCCSRNTVFHLKAVVNHDNILVCCTSCDFEHFDLGIKNSKDVLRDRFILRMKRTTVPWTHVRLDWILHDDSQLYGSWRFLNFLFRLERYSREYPVKTPYPGNLTNFREFPSVSYLCANLSIFQFLVSWVKRESIFARRSGVIVRGENVQILKLQKFVCYIPLWYKWILIFIWGERCVVEDTTNRTTWRALD